MHVVIVCSCKVPAEVRPDCVAGARASGLGCGVWGGGFGVWGLGVGVQGLGCGVWGVGLRV